jgi:hypothetical protein
MELAMSHIVPLVEAPVLVLVSPVGAPESFREIGVPDE